MALIIRIVAFLLSLLVFAGPVALALFISGVEPSRPIQASWVAPFALGGLAFALGYLVIGFAPMRLATASKKVRILVACFMALPCAVATYLLFATGSPAVTVICLALLLATAWLSSACIWPAWLGGMRSNTSLQGTRRDEAASRP